MGLQMLSEIEAKKKSLGFMFAMRKQLLFAAGAEAHLTRKLAVCAGELRATEYAFDIWTVMVMHSICKIETIEYMPSITGGTGTRPISARVKAAAIQRRQPPPLLGVIIIGCRRPACC